MFLDTTDLHSSILPEELQEITRGDTLLIVAAISAAIAEMRTYLYDSYDVDTIFAATGATRHQLLVNLCVDMACYFLVARCQAGMDLEDRLARYKRAIAWLKEAQKSQTYADLPRKATTAEQKIHFMSNTKRTNYY